MSCALVNVVREPERFMCVLQHGHTAQSYTTDFDSVVSGIRRWADPTQSIRFVGMNNPNIDDTAKVVEWATYFLNASNHAAGLADARNYIGYHSYPTFGNFTPDPNSLTGVFSYVDDFVGDKVPAVDAVIAALSPDTLTFLDETGCDMDQVCVCVCACTLRMTACVCTHVCTLWLCRS